MFGNGLEKIIQDYLSQKNLTGENGSNYDFIIDKDGKYAINMWDFKVKKPVFTQEDLEEKTLPIYKEQRIKMLKEEASKDIYNGYTDKDFNTMKVFIDEKRDAYATKKARIINAISCEDVEKIN